MAKQVPTITQADHDAAMQELRAEFAAAAEARQMELNDAVGERNSLAARLATAEADLRAALATAENDKQALVVSHQTDTKKMLQGVVDRCNSQLKQFEQQIAELTTQVQFQTRRADLATQLATHSADEATRLRVLEHELIGLQAATEAKLAAVRAAMAIQTPEASAPAPTIQE
jgi:hypothetical protein